MRCEDAIERIQMAAHPGPELTAAFEHAAACEECSAALAAVDALHSLRADAAPVADERALARAIERALAAAPAARFRRGFAYGAVSGAALAAAVAAVAFGLWLRPPDGAGAGAPEVRLAVNEPRDVTVALESPEPLQGAAVRIELRGAVALRGYQGQRELAWRTDLDRGVNRLTLPVVALDATGGQVLVDVTHGARRRTFLLDVRAGPG
jgi:hypothetical protein